MDFKNMLERERLESKKVSKTQAVTVNLRPARCRQGRTTRTSTSARPTTSPGSTTAKWAYVRLEGRAFGDAAEPGVQARGWDSPNSAGIIIDAVRAAKIAKDRGIGGRSSRPLAYLMKSPPVLAGAGRRRSRSSSPVRSSSRGNPRECALSPRSRFHAAARSGRIFRVNPSCGRVRHLPENVAQAGMTGRRPVPARGGSLISALRHGDAEMVFFLRGGQNTHTCGTP